MEIFLLLLFGPVLLIALGPHVIAFLFWLPGAVVDLVRYLRDPLWRRDEEDDDADDDLVPW